MQMGRSAAASVARRTLATMPLVRRTAGQLLRVLYAQRRFQDQLKEELAKKK